MSQSPCAPCATVSPQGRQSTQSHRAFVLINKTGVLLNAATGFVQLTAEEMDHLCASWMQQRELEREETMKMQTQCLQAAQKATREIYDCVTQPNLQVVLPDYQPTARVPLMPPGQFKLMQK